MQKCSTTERLLKRAVSSQTIDGQSVGLDFIERITLTRPISVKSNKGAGGADGNAGR